MSVRRLTTVDAQLVAEEIAILPAGSDVGWIQIAAMTTIKPALAPGWTRQTLSRNPIVYAAYKLAKKLRRETSIPPSRRPEVREGRLRDEIRILRQTIKDYEARSALWIYNAHLNHLTLEQLEKPMN